MKIYTMTHTKMKSRPRRENTADVATVEAMPKVVNMSSEALAKATTSTNASADEDTTTMNTSNVLLLYRVGEALQASKRSLEGNRALNQRNSWIEYTNAKVNAGIASLVQLVQSINQDESMQKFKVLWTG